MRRRVLAPGGRDPRGLPRLEAGAGFLAHGDDRLGGDLVRRLAAGALAGRERGGDRRVLALANPGLKGLPFTSTTLWGALQYLGPHESAPAHRHTPSAIRFVLTGSGVYTTVNGDACDMEPGDLVLTPIWNWHDHNNRSDEPMI